MREAGRFANALGSPDVNKINGYLKACFAGGTPILWEHGEKPVEAL